MIDRLGGRALDRGADSSPEATSDREKWSQAWEGIDTTLFSDDVWSLMDRRKFAGLREWLPDRGISLEVGCGSARLSVFLAERGLFPVGLDYSMSALRLAGRNFQTDRIDRRALVQGDALLLPFRDGAFDVVLSTGLLEHFEDATPAAQEMVRVLRPGGLFYADIIPDKYSLLRLFDKLLGKREIFFEQRLTVAEVRRMLERAGLAGIGIRTGGIYPPLWLPWFWRLKAYQRFHLRLSRMLQPLLSRWEGTALGDKLGFFYFCTATKPELGSRTR